MKSRDFSVIPLLLLFCLSACGEQATLPVSAGTGPDPVLPPPVETLIPTIVLARVAGWAPGEQPQPAPGLAVQPFATGLDHPRWLKVLPNGDVLVAESKAPPRDGGGLMAWITGIFLDLAGSGGTSANRITLLRDSTGDGRADLQVALLEGLNSPFGMELVGQHLYVANTDAVLRFPYREGQTRIDAEGDRIIDLPAGPLNAHWTRNLIADSEGRLLYVTVGSNSNVGENGLDSEEGRAAIWQVDPQQRSGRVFASGLRNPNGLAWIPAPDSTASNDAASNDRAPVLWTTVNERDMLGSDLVPDYMTAVHDGAFYGWPYSYFGQHVDTRVSPRQPDLVARARVPDYALGPHVAALGLAYVDDPAWAAAWPEPFGTGVYVALRGSWNRDPPSGYRIIHVPFAGGRPAGDPVDVLTGFLGPDGKALGRPVGAAFGADGALLIADDVGNTIWRVAPAAASR